MIRIVRSGVEPPSFLAEVRERELERLREFYRQEVKYQRQRKTTFDARKVFDDDVRAALGAMSNGKCAYCETPLSDVSELVVDLFRPRRGAVRADGRIDPDHYWWLAYDWENMLPSCYACNRNKASRFPIAGRAAVAEARGAELDAERCQLVDPADEVGSPDDHLWVDAEGRIGALSERGDVTIAVLDLNRAELVERRRETYDEATELYVRAREDASAGDLIDEQLGGRLPYTLARRSAYEAASATAAAVGEKHRLSAEFSVVQSAAPDVDDIASGPALWIDRLEAHNFMGLRDFSLQFPAATDPEREPWILLLGQNGVGKSSILKAVALAMADPAERRRLYPDASVLVNRAAGERRGHVRVHLNRGEPVELSFRRYDPEFRSNRPAPPLHLLGYGATRLPAPITATPRTPAPTRFVVGNLFDPWETLSDAEPWLTDTSRVDAAQFDRLASALRELLSLDDRDQIVRYRRKLYVQQVGARVALRQLSDGYQSVVALAMDIMFNLASDWSLMETAEGTVLLDEIEVHLHPQWKVHIVDAIRRLFPRLRFITTTHDPLCLGGALPGELHLIERDDDGLVDVKQVDIPKGTRADQVLTGDWFGLSTTIDDETIALMEEHRLMLLEPLAEQDRARTDELVTILKERLGTYGDTAIDRLALQAAAEEIGRRDIRTLDAEERKTARSNILRLVEQRSS